MTVFPQETDFLKFHSEEIKGIVVNSIYDCSSQSPPKKKSGELLFPAFEECSFKFGAFIELSRPPSNCDLSLAHFRKADGQDLDVRLGSFSVTRAFWEFT